jgi:hypothetical protein
MMTANPVPITSETEETLIDQLQGPNGLQVKDQFKQALDALQTRLQALEQQGVPPGQAKALSAALLAVKSAHGTLDAIQVGKSNPPRPEPIHSLKGRLR